MIELAPDISFRDAQTLAEELDKNGIRLHVEREAESRSGTLDSPERDWRAHLVTCPCGAEFPETGLGGLGKHVANCETGQDELHIGKNGMGSIYRPVVEAVYHWYQDVEFTLPELRERLDGLEIPISYSSIRGHIQWLENQGFLASTKEGRSYRYEFVEAPAGIAEDAEEDVEGTEI